MYRNGFERRDAGKWFTVKTRSATVSLPPTRRGRLCVEIASFVQGPRSPSPPLPILSRPRPSPPMPPNPPQTPLRRLSQGSLFRLSRSGAYPDAPHGLGFLEPALAELIDEAEALQTNVEGLRNLDAALDTFNESFASWLYVMNMNALTTDWPQVRLDLYRTLMRTQVGSIASCCRPLHRARLSLLHAEQVRSLLTQCSSLI